MTTLGTCNSKEAAINHTAQEVDGYFFPNEAFNIRKHGNFYLYEMPEMPWWQVAFHWLLEMLPTRKGKQA